MRTAIPRITERTDELKYRLQREHDSHKKLRLQMLYLLASGQAHTRQDVAHLLPGDLFNRTAAPINIGTMAPIGMCLSSYSAWFNIGFVANFRVETM